MNFYQSLRLNTAVSTRLVDRGLSYPIPIVSKETPAHPGRVKRSMLYQDYQSEESAVEPAALQSSRGSLDGPDSAFASVLRRSFSTGSLPYNHGPLRRAVLS